MREYVTDAVVLAREPAGERDSLVTLWTEHFGKLAAKAKSARKITSKLSAHLEPGTILSVRLVERRTNGLIIADALRRGRARANTSDLAKLERILAEHEPNDNLWLLLATADFSWPEALRILGWDPMLATCDACGQPKPTCFHLARQIYSCTNCQSLWQMSQNELIYIDE
ncbi:MAG: recombination protein O N-terminal domain-containing protein [Candidatus Liptonbacteria bacterium]|nr:recombination protein O N-terminal domain-containing protein [Candidatus Liptonbacteria bacterium]